MFEATVIEHSINPSGQELVTFQLVYPRFIHSELMTHRVFSRNAMSSRAVPIAKMLQQVRENPATPVHWGANQPGMQAHTQLEGVALEQTQALWLLAARNAADIAEKMADQGVHKQIANRILEPYQWMRAIVSATEWVNWDELRIHPDAEPNIHKLASMMCESRRNSPARMVEVGEDFTANWHLPYVSAAERERFPSDPWFLAAVSAARCARVSYLTHDGAAPDVEKDLALYKRLVGSRPMHASPVEHQATPIKMQERSNNFVGWRQFRQIIETAAADRLQESLF